MAKRTACAGAGDSDDLISRQNDDVLLHVLCFLPSAHDVARATVVSRRWRGLWARAPALRLVIDDAEQIEQFYFHDDISDVLSRRCFRDGGGARIDALEISTSWWPGRERVDEWLRLAMEHVAGSIDLRVARKRTFYSGDEEKSGTWVLGELPTRTSAAAISLNLDDARLPLPATAAFRDLAEVSLVSVRLMPGQDDRLGGLLSTPCCPRLRRLSMKSMLGLTELRLEVGALEFLELEYLPSLRQLYVNAHRLRVCAMIDLGWPRYCSSTAAIIRAPALEEVVWSMSRGPEVVELEGWSQVRRLNKVHMKSHLDPCNLNRGGNEFGIELLRCCTSVNRVHVNLDIPEVTLGDDLMAAIPPLPHIIDLILEVRTSRCNSFGPSVAKLLASCSNLRRLTMATPDLVAGFISKEPCPSVGCFCILSTNWADKAILLPHLREVEFPGFAGCQDLAPLVLFSAPILKRMTVTAINWELSFIKVKYLQRKTIESVLPACNRGKWTTAWESTDVPAYKWTSDMVQV